jgi:hypothetical protein
MRIFLHIGLHKTGTTAIQRFLNGIAHILLMQGVLYFPPVVGEYNHHHLASRLRKEDDFAEISREINLQLESFRGLGIHTCIFSSEVFAEHEIPVNRLSELFEGNDLTVLAYLRRPDHQWASAYAQLVKEVAVKRCERIDEDPPPYDCGYSSILVKWMEVFKPGQFVIAPYDKAQWYEGKITLDFLAMIGININILEIGESAKSDYNIRLPEPLVEILRVINGNAKLDDKEHIEFVSALESLAADFPKAFGNSGRTLSPTLASKAFELLEPHLPAYRPYFRDGFDEQYLKRSDKS